MSNGRSDLLIPAVLGVAAIGVFALMGGGGGAQGPGAPAPGLLGPKGKGVFLRAYSHAETPEKLVALLKKMGMTFVFLPITWQRPGGNHRDYTKGEAAYVEALKKAGIEIWVWGWPEPAYAQDFVDVMMAAKDRTGARGIVVNAEKPFYGEDDAARYLASALRTETWALSSYGGGPRNHPGFPWEQFLDFGPVIGMPQLYATPGKFGEGYYQRGVDDWAQVGYSDITPTLSATDNHTPQQMAREAYLTGLTGVQGVSYWDYYWAELSDKRQKAIAGVKIPLPGAKAVA